MANWNLPDASTVMENLYLKYRPLVGMVFPATYLGPFMMPQTENERDVLLILTEAELLREMLRKISNAVLQNYGKRVWKGITGSQDSARYPDFWLWFEPGFNEVLMQEDFCYEFEIKQCRPFQCRGGDFDFGVSIKVVAIPESGFKLSEP